MPYNPKSLANLGKPRTKARRKNFTLTTKSIEWLDQQKNQSNSIDSLIEEQIMIEQLAEWLKNNTGDLFYYDAIDDDECSILCYSNLTNGELWQKYQPNDYQDLIKMYGENDANRYPMYEHKWRGLKRYRNNQNPDFWVENAKAILSDPHVGKVENFLTKKELILER
jgi:hypothetical protein